VFKETIHETPRPVANNCIVSEPHLEQTRALHRQLV
jgi:hypothetical protein